MVKRGAGGTGMTSGEKLLGGMALAVYVFVLPLTAEWLFNGAEKVFGVSLDRGARDLAYYAVLFGLVLIAFWGFFGRNTRAFFDRTWQVLGAAGVGEGAQDAVIAVAVVALMLVATLILLSEKELTGRVLGLLRAGPVNLNDQAILARLGAAPRSTVLIVVFLAPVVEEALFRGYVFGNLREYSRGAAYVVSCLFFALIHVWPFFAESWDMGCLMVMVQYLVPGAVMAWTYERSGCLWGSVLLHCAVNGLAVWLP